MKLSTIIFSLLACCHSVNAGSTLNVTGGSISGTTEDGVCIFKGIPYAAPPVGDLRWKAPQPVIPWDGIRSCKDFGPVCPQRPFPAGSLYHFPAEPQSEDCLFLNVWAPNKPTNTPLPVMVWIHGGGWTRGSGSTFVYDGASLARRGVVVVTINYRLGAFGFLAHPELTAESPHGASGNQGILDQIAALEWVQKNIEQFGGNPDQVTIFGESAGSWSVHLLQATPLAKGLFHRAIGQSGARFDTTRQLDEAIGDEPSAHEQGVSFAEACEVSTLKELRELPAERIVKTSFDTGHTVDGYVLPDSVRNIFVHGKQNRVPILIGSNADEMTSLSVPALIPKTVDAVTKALTKRMGVEATEKFRTIYGVHNDESAMRAFLQIGGDTSFAAGMRVWVRVNNAAGISSYLYYFSHVPPSPSPEYFRAYHAGEIAYVFGNTLDREGTTYDADDRKLSDTMSRYWVNFATTGNPNGEGLPEWPEYDSTNEGYIELGDPVEAKQHLLKDRLDFLESLVSEQ